MQKVVYLVHDYRTLLAKSGKGELQKYSSQQFWHLWTILSVKGGHKSGSLCPRLQFVRLRGALQNCSKGEAN